MSTILKALRRLEKEKTRSDRPLREQVTGLGGAGDPDAGAPRRWPILVGGVAAGIVAGVAVLLLVLSRGEAPPPPSTAEPAPALAEGPRPQPPEARPQAARAGRGMIQPIPPGEVPAVNPARPAARAATEPPPPIDADDVEVIDRGVPGPRLAPEVAEAATPAAPTPPAPGSVRPFERGQRGAVASAPRAVAPAPADRAVPPPAPTERAAVAPVPAERAAVAPAPTERAAVAPIERAAVAPAPSERAAPPPAPAEAPPVARTRETAPTPQPAEAEPGGARPAIAKAPSRPPPPPADPFPALRVERTTWHPSAERRLAVVEVPGEGARELREGDAVAGATVALIEPSGVVFRFAGRDVRRPVGSPRPD